MSSHEGMFDVLEGDLIEEDDAEKRETRLAAWVREGPGSAGRSMAAAQWEGMTSEGKADVLRVEIEMMREHLNAIEEQAREDAARRE